MNAESKEVYKVLDKVPLDILQFHGAEDPEYCGQFGRSYIKALGIRDPSMNLSRYYKKYSNARALLLDGHAEGAMGGSGKTLNWHGLKERIVEIPKHALILAGGLDIHNVGRAVEQSGIPSLDVSSGVESAPGIKELTLMNVFVQRANESCIE